MGTIGNRLPVTIFGVIEVILYFLFLATFTLMAHLQSPKDTFYYNSILQKLFLTKPFYSARNVRDFWEAIREPDKTYFDYYDSIFHNFYWEEYYGPQSRFINLANVKPLDPTEEKLGILYENKILGLPRFRQIRVKSKPCPINADKNEFPTLDQECFPPYSVADEDTGDSSGHWEEFENVPTAVQEAWVYKSNPSSLISHWGRLGSYSSGGAEVNLGRRKVETKVIVEHLYQNEWISRSTRAVFLDFTLYNANLNTFCVIRLLWEFHPSGNVVPSYTFNIVRLIKYITIQEKMIVLPCELIFCAFTIYHTVMELIKCFRVGCLEHLKQFWSYLEIIILLISYGCIAFRLLQFFVYEDLVHHLVKDENRYYDFQSLTYWVRQYERAVAIVLFGCWVKVCKYLTFSKIMYRFSNTLARSAKEVFGFGVMFFVIYLAFAQAGHLIFGSEITEFSTYGRSCFALLSLLIGEFSITDVQSANRVLGPIFYLAFMIFVFLVIVNMFIAILNNTYSEVKAQIQTEDKMLENRDLPKNILGRNNPNRLMSMSDIKKNLNKLNYSRTEIELFVARFDLIEEHQPCERGRRAKEDESMAAEAGSETENQVEDIKPQTTNEYIVTDVSFQPDEYFELYRRLQDMESKYSNTFKQLNEMLAEVTHKIEIFHETHSGKENVDK